MGNAVVTDSVKVAARPSITIEETEINYLNDKTWIPKKGTWEAITVTHFDTSEDVMKPFWEYCQRLWPYLEKKEEPPADPSICAGAT